MHNRLKNTLAACGFLAGLATPEASLAANGRSKVQDVFTQAYSIGSPYGADKRCITIPSAPDRQYVFGSEHPTVFSVPKDPAKAADKIGIYDEGGDGVPDVIIFPDNSRRYAGNRELLDTEIVELKKQAATTSTLSPRAHVEAEIAQLTQEKTAITEQMKGMPEGQNKRDLLARLGAIASLLQQKEGERASASTASPQKTALEDRIQELQAKRAALADPALIRKAQTQYTHFLEGVENNTAQPCAAPTQVATPAPLPTPAPVPVPAPAATNRLPAAVIPTGYVSLM